ncbi:TPA: hypothetical protein ACQQME_002641, partial [Enterococcus hirae]
NSYKTPSNQDFFTLLAAYTYDYSTINIRTPFSSWLFIYKNNHSFTCMNSSSDRTINSLSYPKPT